MVITLIGMAGAGKSAAGEALAVRLGHAFIDVDKIIEREEGGSLQAVLDRLGTARFLRREAEAVLGLAGIKDAVISPGGSIVYSEDAMRFLRKISFVIYLMAPLEEIKQRVGSGWGLRGVVGLADRSVDELFVERAALYEKHAQATVGGMGRSVNDIVGEIERAIGQ